MAYVPLPTTTQEYRGRTLTIRQPTIYGRTWVGIVVIAPRVGGRRAYTVIGHGQTKVEAQDKALARAHDLIDRKG